MKKALVLAAALMPLTAASAAEDGHKEHGAHVHGHGTFNIAIEGKTVAMELVAPGADIVGFEHVAKSEADKQAVTEGRQALSDLNNVVTLPQDAGCSLKKVSVAIETEGEHDDHDHKAEKHDDHGHKAKKTGEKEETHGEFHAEYTLACSAPEKLNTMTFVYFDTFKGAQELDVTVIGPKQQQKYEVNRKNLKIALGGII